MCHQYHSLIGASPSMQNIYHKIDKVAKSNASVLITGETGTGKELCASAIHKESHRNNKPFIVLNCATIPKELMESEFFGYVPGAFTGALKTKQGFAYQATNGTLFLDEIGDMDITLQSKLLRLVQDGSFYKLGSDKLEKVNIRFICATHRVLPLEIKAGRFREDLYHRLNVIPINLPPLRERGNDILLLTQHFLKKYTRIENKTFQNFTQQIEQIFLSYRWPGNIRELQNVIKRIVVLNEEQSLSSDTLLTYLRENSVHSFEPEAQVLDLSVVEAKKIRPLEEVEKEAILEAVNFCHGNVVLAAELLKVSKATLYRRLRKWGINLN